jgi:hypothetical protein
MTTQEPGTRIGVPTEGPAEGRPDLPLPGADREHGLPDNEAERRDALAERVGAGTPPAAASQEPDVLPDVEPPEATM